MVSDPSGRADPEAVALLRSARQQAEASLSAEHRARLAARLAGSLGPPPGPGDPPPAAPAPGSPAAGAPAPGASPAAAPAPGASGPAAPAPSLAPPGASTLAAAVTSKAAVAAVSLLLGGALGFQARGVIDTHPAASPRAASEPGAPRAPSSASGATAAPPPASGASAAPAAPGDIAVAPPALGVVTAPPGTGVVAAPSSSAPRAPAAEASAPLGREESLRAERALVDMARTALGRGQADSALTALRRHATEFPAGRLIEEREGMWIQALAVSGRPDEARARLERFRRSFPRSMMLPGLESALGSRP